MNDISSMQDIIEQQRRAIELANERFIEIGKERAKLIEVLKAAREVTGWYWDDKIPEYDIRRALKACADIEVSK